MPLGPPDDLVRRFRASLAGLAGEAATAYQTFGIAVSGGPDSLALLLLAAAALPGRVYAATVDHGFRPEGRTEAAFVADVCARLDVPHDTLALGWSPPRSNRQAGARQARYARLAEWAIERQAGWLATAHHLDDQAETLLMRLHRGAGVDGLAGIRPIRPLGPPGADGPRLIRPLLTWSKDELRAVVAGCGLTPMEDPSNVDPRHDRTAARAFLEASAGWPDRHRLAASADHLREAGEALEWVTAELLGSRLSTDGPSWLLDVRELPSDLLRRLTIRTIRQVSGEETAVLRGDELARAIGRLRSGEVTALAGVIIRPSAGEWRFEVAPPRRS